MPLAKALVLDIDGVITDGTLEFSTDGGQSKAIRFRDIGSINRARLAGLKIGLLTGESGALVDAVVSFVKPDVVISGAMDKFAGIQDMCTQLGVELSETCYAGDSDRDAPAISAVGFGMAPADGTAIARAAASRVLKSIGGDGVVEEIVGILLHEAPSAESDGRSAPDDDDISKLVSQRLNESVQAKAEFANQQSYNVARAAAAIAKSYSQGGKVLCCGNGGSAADAQHMAGEFVGHLMVERPPLPAIALSSDPSIMTAIGNDYGFAEVFSRQVSAHAVAGDVVVGFSTSGNSENVVKAFEMAREIGASTIAFTGDGGGAMGALADVLIAAPSTVTPRIQECHVAAMHAVCEAVDVLLGYQILPE
jgi:D-sedoheptulose 7-phosphate isomerase